MRIRPSATIAPSNEFVTGMSASWGIPVVSTFCYRPCQLFRRIKLRVAAPLPGLHSLQAVFEQYQQAQGGEKLGFDVLQFRTE